MLTSHPVTRVGIEGPGNFDWPAAIYLLDRRSGWELSHPERRWPAAALNGPGERLRRDPIRLSGGQGSSAAVAVSLPGRSPTQAVRDVAYWRGGNLTLSELLRSCVPNGVRTRAAALKARNWAFFDTFQDLSFSAETCCD